MSCAGQLTQELTFIGYRSPRTALYFNLLAYYLMTTKYRFTLLRLWFVAGALLTAAFAGKSQIRLDLTGAQFKEYAPGDTFRYTIHADTSLVAQYTIEQSPYLPPIESGTIALDSGSERTVNFLPGSPGNYFFHLHTDDTTYFTISAITGRYALKPVEPLPPDFDAYWDNIRAMVDSLPMDVHIEEDTTVTAQYSTTYRIDLANIEGRRVYAYMTIPDTDGPFPAMIKFPAFGNTWTTTPDPPMAEYTGAIVLSLNIHSAPMDSIIPDDLVYTPDIAVSDTVYYRWAMAGAMRLLNYLETRDDFEGAHIGAYGDSQGAGLAMLFAGIDPRINLVIANAPVLAQHNGLKYNRPSGFPLYIKYALNDPVDRDRILKAVKYYDVVNSMQRYHGPILTAVSLMDDISPSETIYTALNQHDGPLLHYHNLIGKHADSPPGYWEARFDLMRRFFPTNPSWPWPQTTTGYIASAGQDTIIDSSSLLLTGSVEHNGTTNPPGIFATQWVQMDGPAPVTFADSLADTTQVFFPDTGTYILRFVAIDTNGLANLNVYATFEDVIRITVLSDINCQLHLTTPAQDRTIYSCIGLQDSLNQWLTNHAGAGVTPDTALTWTDDFTTLTGTPCHKSATVHFTATDTTCGTSIQFAATFSLLDTTPPTFVHYPDTLILHCLNGQMPTADIDTWLLARGNAQAIDDCQAATFWSHDYVSSSCTDTSIAVRFVARDACMNTDTAVGIIVVDTLTALHAPPAETTLRARAVPNPFSKQFLIQYKSPQSGNLHLRIYSPQGKILYDVRRRTAGATGEVRIPPDIFPTSGLYYFTLRINDHTASGILTKQ